MFDGKRILILAPHIDDGEFGCGGTIARLVRSSCEVKYIAFSDCRESLPEGLSADTLRKELKVSTTSLNIDQGQVDVLDFKVRYFHEARQQILQTLVDVRKSYNPEIIFTPSGKDIHQDHQVINAESIRAFKNQTILGYELPWNCFTLPSEMIVKLEESDIAAKITAINSYASQQHRPYHDEEYIRSLAITRGRRINEKYGEAFEPIRIVV